MAWISVYRVQMTFWLHFAWWGHSGKSLQFLLVRMRKEDEMKGRMRRKANKAREGRRGAKGVWPLTFVLWLGHGGGSEDATTRVISNYLLDMTHRQTEEKLDWFSPLLIRFISKLTTQTSQRWIRGMWFSQRSSESTVMINCQTSQQITLRHIRSHLIPTQL